MNGRFRQSINCIRMAALLLGTMVTGCVTGKEVVLTSRGTWADVSFGTMKLNAELLALQNDTLYVLADSLLAFPVQGITAVTLDIDEGREWVTPVIALEFLPATILVHLESRDVQRIGVLGGALGVLIWGLFEFSSPQALYRFPLDREQTESLQLHMRFPYGIDKHRLDEIGGRKRYEIPGVQ